MQAVVLGKRICCVCRQADIRLSRGELDTPAPTCRYLRSSISVLSSDAVPSESIASELSRPNAAL